MAKLAASHVCVFGLGGVGSFCVEALARAGVGALTVVDNDTISASNINRQLFATHDTIGQHKVDVAFERIKAINPACNVIKVNSFYLPETRGDFDFHVYDYIVDAIDTVSAKLDLVCAAHDAKVPIISCMGTGNKLNPTMLEVADISHTSVCRLAKVIRKELRKRGITTLKCVYSKEEPIKVAETPSEQGMRRSPVPGSVSFVPSAAGLILAGEVVKDLCGINQRVQNDD